MKRIVQDDMYKMAKDFKKYFEDNKKAPYMLTYHNIDYYTKDMTYIFVYGLFHLKNNFNVVDVDWCNNANGDRIKEDILIGDYKQQAKDVYNYILKNKKVPDFVTTKKSKKKVNIDLFTYCLSKILVYYKEHGKLPDTCEYNSVSLEARTTTLETLYSVAKKVKEYVEQNYALPSEIDGFRHGEYTYLFCIANYQGGRTYKREGIGMAKSQSGDTIHNQKIYRSAYVDIAHKIVDFANNNHHLPNYVTWNGYKIKAHLYEYAFAKIIEYHSRNGQFPNYVTVDSDAFVKPKPKPVVEQKRKYSHATKSGCDNMGQNNGYYCGCHSLQEVFRNLTGIVVSQRTIAGWASTTTAGTGHWGLETAVAKFNSVYGENLKVQWRNFSDLGWSGIKEIVNSNNKDCVIHNNYRNQWGHYEVVNEVSGNINVQNSLGSSCSQGCYCGYIEYRTKREYESYINGISQKSIMVITNE